MESAAAAETVSDIHHRWDDERGGGRQLLGGAELGQGEDAGAEQEDEIDRLREDDKVSWISNGRQWHLTLYF